MATLRNTNGFFGLLFGAKPRVRQTPGLKAFAEKTLKENSEPTEKLVEIYRAYKVTRQKHAA